MATEQYIIIQGECEEKLAEFEDESLDCIITSPPYNLNIKYGKYKDNKSREDYLKWLVSIFKIIKQKLKPDGQIYLNMGYSNIDPWISMEVALAIRNETNLILQNKITWVKSISIGDDTKGQFKPINSERFINPTNEDIYHFTKTGSVEIDRKIIGVPYVYKCNLKERNKKKNKTGGEKEDKRCKGNTWFIPYKTIQNKKDKGYHPATYPVELAEHCIKLSGLTEGVIVDPFVGTGTTIQAVKQLNEQFDNDITEELSEIRKIVDDESFEKIKENMKIATPRNKKYNLRGIGIDIDEEYVKFSKKRLGLEVAEEKEEEN